MFSMIGRWTVQRRKARNKIAARKREREMGEEVTEWKRNEARRSGKLR